LQSLLLENGRKQPKLELQTVYNPSDGYGKLLERHCETFDVGLLNIRGRATRDHKESTTCADSEKLVDTEWESTGHCVVLVHENERSFLTHLGCVSHFVADDIDTERFSSWENSYRNEDTINSQIVDVQAEGRCRHHQHIHIAGYYNIEGFWDGKLKKVLNSVRTRRSESNSSNGCSSHSTTTMSLVPQFDASNKWDGQILDLLSCIDFLVLSESEAFNISRSNTSTPAALEGRTDCEATTKLDREPSTNSQTLQSFASFFNEKGLSRLFIIVTMGDRGAAVLRGGKILFTNPASKVDVVVDPTGAGDAFAAGFIYGYLRSREHNTRILDEDGCNDAKEEEYVHNGLKWGNALGAACVKCVGASSPCSQEDITCALSKV